MELVKDYKGTPTIKFGVLYFEKSYFIINNVKYNIVGVVSNPYNIYFKEDGKEQIFSRSAESLKMAFKL